MHIQISSLKKNVFKQIFPLSVAILAGCKMYEFQHQNDTLLSYYPLPTSTVSIKRSQHFAIRFHDEFTQTATLFDYSIFFLTQVKYEADLLSM